MRTQANHTRHHGPTQHAPGSPFSSGTAGFGAKAEEESRLINDSGAKRSAQVRRFLRGSWGWQLMIVHEQVFLVFGGAFLLAVTMSRGGGRPDKTPDSVRR